MKLYLFDRMYKLIHFDDLSVLSDGIYIDECVSARMSKNEIFVLQIAVLPKADDVIESISVNSNLNISCINTDIVDKFGNKSNASVKLKANTLQPLFFTVQSSDSCADTENAIITIHTANESRSFTVCFELADIPVVNKGYNDLWRLSRLNWLNSSLAIDETLVKPFVSPALSDDVLTILGRDIVLDDSGLPQQVCSKFDEAVQLCDDMQKALFAKPAEFAVGDYILGNGKTESNLFANRIESRTVCGSDDLDAEINSVLRYDGQMEYSVIITPKKDFNVKNTALNFYINKDCSLLMHGLGHRASAAENLSFKWDNDKQQDCIFVGTVNCGMRVKLKAENYRRPLINIFYKNLPLNVPVTTWDNNGRGGIDVRVKDCCTNICAYTGEFAFKKGEAREFRFELHFTPFKPIDYKKAFTVRYSHSNELKDEYKEIDRAAKNGLNYVTFHQGNMIMPFINYPFYEVDRLKKAVSYAKEKGIGIKLYYTEREHSNHMAETFVYKALGDEIILRKQGVSHSWQKEKPQWLVDNFGDDIISGWFVKYKHGKYKNDPDVSFIVRPDTRLDNYYIEGLNWLVENVGIEGIYIDDTSLDRTTIERAKKILDRTDGLIDMHMWNHEEPRAGDVSCLNLYAELLPFLDSIWLGEGFFYKKYSPEYMLCEVSGIPYGITGQMLEGGGDFYAGMLYGMNNRFGWGYTNAVQMYKVWDDFGIADSRMLGYWHSENPVKTNNKNVLATAYVKENEALLCFYNFSDKKEKFAVELDEKLLGFIPSSAKEIRFGRSRQREIDMNKTIALGKRKGIIIKVAK